MQKLLFLIAIIFLKPTDGVAIPAMEDVKQYELISDFYTLNDSTKALAFEQIVKLRLAGKFRLNTKFAENQGVGDYNYWSYFVLTKNTTRGLNLFLENSTIGLDSMEVFIIKNDRLFLRKKIVKNEANLPDGSYANAILLPFHDSGVYDIYVLSNKSVGLMRACFTVQSEAYFLQNQRFTHYKILFLVGVVFISVLFGLILFFQNRENLYLIFVGNILFKLLAIIATYNFGQNLFVGFLKNVPWSTHALAFFIFQFLFYNSFVKTNKYKNLVNYSAAVLCFFYVLNIFSPENVLVYYTTSFTTFVSVLVFIFILLGNLSQKTTLPWVYLVAELPFLLVMAIVLLKVVFKDLTIFIFNTDIDTFYFIILIEILIFLVALVIRNNSFQKLSLVLSEKLNKSQAAIIEIQESERKFLAQDIHDDLGGTLSAIKGKVASESLDPKTLHLVEKAIEDLRSISRNLLPPELTKNGLVKAIQQNVKRLQSKTLRLTFITFGKEVRMNSDRELNTYRIVSELLNNVVKHSNASKATVQIIFYDRYLQVLIEDNGTGIKTKKMNLGIGLKNVNSRIEFLGAKLLRDTNQNGTVFIFELPYE